MLTAKVVKLLTKSTYKSGHDATGSYWLEVQDVIKSDHQLQQVMKLIKIFG